MRMHIDLTICHFLLWIVSTKKALCLKDVGCCHNPNDKNYHLKMTTNMLTGQKHKLSIFRPGGKK